MLHRPEDPADGDVGSFSSTHPVTALTFGSSHVDANPEQQEEDSKAHEKRGHQGDEELFVDIPSVLGGGNLITGRVIKEKQRDGLRRTGSLASAALGKRYRVRAF